MSDQKGKKGFEWKEGGTLSDNNSSPLGDVRQHGLPKISKALAENPEKRREEREKFLAEKQSRPYTPSQPEQKTKELVIEEDSKDISGEFEDSEVKRLTGKGQKIRGLDRFQKK